MSASDKFSFVKGLDRHIQEIETVFGLKDEQSTDLWIEILVIIFLLRILQKWQSELKVKKTCKGLAPPHFETLQRFA